MRLNKNRLRTTSSDGIVHMESNKDGTLHSQRCLNKSILYSFDSTVVLPAQQQSIFAFSATHTFFPSFSIK